MNMATDVPRELREKIEQELEPGERIQWIDTPVARLFSMQALGLVLFGIPWTAFALFWTGMAAWGTSQDSHGPGLFRLFPLFGLPFILIGLGMLSSPLWLRRKARRTVYAITDRRAISIEGGWSTTVRSYAPSNLLEISRRERRDGTGDIILSRRSWRDSDGDRRTQEHGFMQVRDVREVEKLLRQLAARVQPVGIAGTL